MQSFRGVESLITHISARLGFPAGFVVVEFVAGENQIVHAQLDVAPQMANLAHHFLTVGENAQVSAPLLGRLRGLGAGKPSACDETGSDPERSPEAGEYFGEVRQA